MTIGGPLFFILVTSVVMGYLMAPEDRRTNGERERPERPAADEQGAAGPAGLPAADPPG